MSLTKDLHILYVEDEPMSRRVMQMLLVSVLQLSNVVIFEDSTDFVERLTSLESPPDIVLLDIHMTPYTGFEMLSMLRELEQFKETPVIALTASVMNEEIQQLKSAGFDGCISKPIDIDEFPKALEAIMQGKKFWRIIH